MKQGRTKVDGTEWDSDTLIFDGKELAIPTLRDPSLNFKPCVLNGSLHKGDDGSPFGRLFAFEIQLDDGSKYIAKPEQVVSYDLRVICGR